MILWLSRGLWIVLNFKDVLGFNHSRMTFDEMPASLCPPNFLKGTSDKELDVEVQHVFLD